MRVSTACLFAVAEVVAAFSFAPAAHADDAQKPGRVLVWANPGASGDAMEPANWTAYASADDYAAGKSSRAGNKVPDANTDIILPDAPEGGNYIVGFFDGGRRQDAYREPPRFACGNITIGHGAALDGGAGQSRGHTVFSSHPDLDAGLEIRGNVAVADGGYLYAQLVFAGDRDATFTVGKTAEPLTTRPHRPQIRRRRRDDPCQRIQHHPRRARRVGPACPGDGDTPGLQCQPWGPRGARQDPRKPHAGNRQGRRPRGLRLRPSRARRWSFSLARRWHASRRPRTPPPTSDSKARWRFPHPQPASRPRRPRSACAWPRATAASSTRQAGSTSAPPGRSSTTASFVITAADPNGPAKADTGISVFLETPADFGDVTFDYLRSGGIVSRDPAVDEGGAGQGDFRRALRRNRRRSCSPG